MQHLEKTAPNTALTKTSTNSILPGNKCHQKATMWNDILKKICVEFEGENFNTKNAAHTGHSELVFSLWFCFKTRKTCLNLLYSLLNHYLSNFLSLRPMHHDDAGTDFGKGGRDAWVSGTEPKSTPLKSQKLLLLIMFISCYSPLSSRLTALTCDFTRATSFL